MQMYHFVFIISSLCLFCIQVPPPKAFDALMSKPEPELHEKKAAEDERRICQRDVDITYKNPKTNGGWLARAHKGELKKQLATGRASTFRGAAPSHSRAAMKTAPNGKGRRQMRFFFFFFLE